MKYNLKLRGEIERFRNYVIIVEGRKDISSLKAVGFERVYAIHNIGIPLKERIEQIILEVEKKDKVCILTDFDKQGKKLYIMLKKEFQELGVRVDSTLRGILIKSGISHIEGLYQFIKKIERI